MLARRDVYLKNPYVLEALAEVDAVVFDKTGTLTAAGISAVNWQGLPLNETEERWLFSMTRHSTHPRPFGLGRRSSASYFPSRCARFGDSRLRHGRQRGRS